MEHRFYSRVPAEPWCRAQFHLGGQAYSDIPVANLGADGCCLRILSQSAGRLCDKALLDGWELIHPGLPKGSIKAKVAWVQGQDRARSGFIETGVQFLDAPEDYRRKLAYYVVNVSQPRPLDQDETDELDDMPDVPE